jgi:hypothetical protein
VNLGDGVAVRVAALCLDRTGRLPNRLLSSDAVRAGLLVDLALAGRMTTTDDSIVIDETPTGFAPADRLLAAMVAESERSLDDWLAERRVGLRDVVAANLAAGRWERRAWPFGLRARYADRHREQTRRDLSRSMADWPEHASPADACVTVVAAAGGLLDRHGGSPQHPTPAVLAATGPTEWLCPTIVEHLQQADARYRAQAGALGSGAAF